MTNLTIFMLFFTAIFFMKLSAEEIIVIFVFLTYLVVQIIATGWTVFVLIVGFGLMIGGVAVIGISEVTLVVSRGIAQFASNIVSFGKRSVSLLTESNEKDEKKNSNKHTKNSKRCIRDKQNVRSSS